MTDIRRAEHHIDSSAHLGASWTRRYLTTLNGYCPLPIASLSWIPEGRSSSRNHHFCFLEDPWSRVKIVRVRRERWLVQYSSHLLLCIPVSKSPIMAFQPSLAKTDITCRYQTFIYDSSLSQTNKTTHKQTNGLIALIKLFKLTFHTGLGVEQLSTDMGIIFE